MKPRFRNGSEHADWAEVWCWRCRHDHDMTHPGASEVGGCDVALRMVIEEDTPELVDAGYVVEYHDPDDGTPGSMIVPDVDNAIPAATFCTNWEPCDEACRRHVNGAVIDAITRTEAR